MNVPVLFIEGDVDVLIGVASRNGKNRTL